MSISIDTSWKFWLVNLWNLHHNERQNCILSYPLLSSLWKAYSSNGEGSSVAFIGAKILLIITGITTLLASWWLILICYIHLLCCRRKSRKMVNFYQSLLMRKRVSSNGIVVLELCAVSIFSLLVLLREIELLFIIKNLSLTNNHCWQHIIEWTSPNCWKYHCKGPLAIVCFQIMETECFAKWFLVLQRSCLNTWIFSWRAAWLQSKVSSFNVIFQFSCSCSSYWRRNPEK